MINTVITAISLFCSCVAATADLDIREITPTKRSGPQQTPKIVFDNRPETGVPQEARAQMKADSNLTRAELNELYGTLTAQGEEQSWPIKFHDTVSTIKTVRIRYFNKETWETEKHARDYVRGLLANKSSKVFHRQIWSGNVTVPEIECLVEFTDEYRRKLRDERMPCDVGRLLIWNTQACFRDAAGRWWFVNLFDHYHRTHPKGDRELAK